MTQTGWEWWNCRDSARATRRYVKSLRLAPSEVTACKSALGKIAHVLHNHVKSPEIDIHRVKTCGSVGKCTASSRASSDLDLVVFIKNLEPGEIATRIDRILDAIQTALDQQYPGARDEKFYRKFGLRYVIAGMEIDILIGAVNVKPKDFLNFLNDSEQRAFLSSSVSHLATRFMAKQGLFFKDMVRILKDWRDSHDSWPRQCKPRSYLLEVLLLHACRETCGRNYKEEKNYLGYWTPCYSRNMITNTLICFFEMVGGIQPPKKGKQYTKDTVSLYVAFDTYYQSKDIPDEQPEPLFQSTMVFQKKNGNKTRTTRHANALVLDPTNPTNNLWLTLAVANPFLERARATAKRLKEGMVL